MPSFRMTGRTGLPAAGETGTASVVDAPGYSCS